MVKLKHLVTVVASMGCLTAVPGTAMAQVKIGVILPLTGPGAIVGVAHKNSLAIWPTEIAGEKIEMLVEDDRSDVTAGTTIARRMMTDDKVDLIIGPGLTTGAVAVAPVANEGETVQMAIAPIPPLAGKDKWSFNVTPPNSLMAAAIIDHMRKHGIKTIGLIGYADTWGDQFTAELTRLGEPAGIKLIANERFGRADPSISGQTLKVISSKPDAIFAAASFAGSALVQKTLRDLRYQGPIYHTQGIDRGSFIRLAGAAAAEGAYFVTTPMTLAETLPDSFPTKAKSLAYVQAVEGKFGPEARSAPAGANYDIAELLKPAIEAAKKKGKPGTKEFRAALRDALEQGPEVIGATGVFKYSPQDHSGLLDERSRVVGVVKNGQYVMAD